MSRAVYEKMKKTCQLPSPTGVALEILRLADNEETTIDAITSAVESDPAISARMLKVVNSPLCGVSRTISSVSSAIRLLGLATVKSLALGFSLLSNNRSGPCQAFDHEAFWGESLARAVTARSVVGHLRTFAPDEAFTIGLLSQMGRLALATAFPEAYAHALSLVQGDEADTLTKIEGEVFEINHNELTAEMMADWKLADIFRDAARRQDLVVPPDEESKSRASQLARILHLAGSVASVITQVTVYRDSLTALVNEANRLGIKPDVFPQMFDEIGVEWRDAGKIFSLSTREVPALAEIYTRSHSRRDKLECVSKAPQPRSVL